MIGGDIFDDDVNTAGFFGGIGHHGLRKAGQLEQDFNTTDYFAGLYGHSALPGAIRFSWSGGYTYGNARASRVNPNVGLLTGGTAVSAFSTQGVFGSIKLSKTIETASAVTFTPFIGATYSRFWMGKASETGGGDFNFTIPGTFAQSIVAVAGAEAVVPLNMEIKGAPLTLFGGYMFGYDFLADNPTTHDIVAQHPIFGNFDLNGSDAGRIHHVANIALQADFKESFSGRIGVNATVSSHGWQLGTNAHLTWTF